MVEVTKEETPLERRNRQRANPPEAKSLGKCLECGAPIIHVDEPGGNVHCRNGHVYAKDAKPGEDAGLVTAQEIKRRKDEAKVIAPTAEETGQK